MTKKINIKDLLINNGIIILMIVMAIYVSITEPTFMTLNNITNILINMAPRIIIALGVSGCLITKGTDLSAGRIAGLSACIAGTLLQRADYSGKIYPDLPEMNIFVVLLICIAVCCVFGLINGLVISYLNVPPFIGTLGMQLIVYGICLVYTNATPIGGYIKSYTDIATGKLINIEHPISKITNFLIIIALLIGVFMWFLYNHTCHGKYMYAIGGNENAAEVSGVNVKKTKVIIYTLAAAMYAIAGYLLGAKAGGASVNLGQSYELDAIAACTIGGVSVNGGIGKISSVIIGVAVFELLKSCLQFLGVDTNAQYIAQGIVIVTAIALDIRKYVAKK